MTETPKSSTIVALENALANSPNDADMRIHLAELLQASGYADQSLEHARFVLQTSPDNVKALHVASVAADKLGDPAAQSYTNLLRALSATADENISDEPETPVKKVPQATPTSSVPDSPDALLEMWDESEAPPEPEIGELSASTIKLEDVAGMNAVKQRLQTSFLNPMRNPEMLYRFGQPLRGGMVLWGPPGCGKTFLAKACAGELGANFYSVGLADVLDMWVGSSERNLAAIFDVARRNTPCVLFFDEVDALGHKRDQALSSGTRGVINQFLSELDGANNKNDGVFVLAATNHPWDIDTALIRPGRFDHMMLVLPPDLKARESILAYHFKDKPQENIDFSSLAAKTKGYSGADLALIARLATEQALADSIDSAQLRPITKKQVKQVLKQVKPSTGPWLEMARNYALYSNKTGQYDELLNYLNSKGNTN